MSSNYKNVDELFVKYQIVKLKLINDCIEKPGLKLQPAKKIAQENGVSDLTVKKVEKELARKGYLFSNKKGGTRSVEKFSKEQISSYITAKEGLKSISETLLKDGFSKEDIMALVYDVLSKLHDSFSKIIYSEMDENIAIFAKKQLEEVLGSNVIFKPFDTLKTELMNKIISDKLIILPFFCYPQLEKYIYEDVKVVPIKTVHPLELISKAHDIPFASRIFYIAASRKDKENAVGVYFNAFSTRYRFYTYTQDELLTSKHLINLADIVIGYRWIIEPNIDLFRKVKRIFLVDRFDDYEGIELIKSYLEEIMGDR